MDIYNMLVIAVVILLIGIDLFWKKTRVFCGVTYLPTKEMKRWEIGRDILLGAFIIFENGVFSIQEPYFSYIGAVICIACFIFFKFYYTELCANLRYMYRHDKKRLAKIYDNPKIVFYGYLLFSIFLFKHGWYIFHH